MSKTDTWMPLYVGDYLADTTRFSTAQHGAYFLLILDYWRNGPPPDDDATLAQIVKCSLSEWRRMRPMIAAKFSLVGGVWHHKRIDAERERARVTSAERKQAGKKGGERSAANRAAKAEANAQANDEANASILSDVSYQQKATQSQSQLHTPSLRSGGKRAPQKTPLPAGFAISDRVREWAVEKGHVHLAERFEHFVGKVRANGYRYADWDDAFMTAIRDDWAKLDGKRVNGHATTQREREQDNLNRLSGVHREFSDAIAVGGTTVSAIPGRVRRLEDAGDVG